MQYINQLLEKNNYFNSLFMVTYLELDMQPCTSYLKQREQMKANSSQMSRTTRVLLNDILNCFLFSKIC